MLNNVKYLNSDLITGYVSLLVDRLSTYSKNNEGDEVTHDIFLGLKSKMKKLNITDIDHIGKDIIECLELVPNHNLGIMVYEFTDEPKFNKLVELLEDIEKVLENEHYPIKLKIECNNG